jgi:hypothetical protein
VNDANPTPAANSDATADASTDEIVDVKPDRELSAEEIAALTPEERQIRALKIEREGLLKRDLPDRVKQVDAQLKYWTAQAKKASSK